MKRIFLALLCAACMTGMEAKTLVAYFSATGDTKVIEKIEKTMHVYDRLCCFECLQNSLLFRSVKNRDVYDKLVEIRDTTCEKAPNPTVCAAYYNNRYIPPANECAWSEKKH